MEVQNSCEQSYKTASKLIELDTDMQEIKDSYGLTEDEVELIKVFNKRA